MDFLDSKVVILGKSYSFSDIPSTPSNRGLVEAREKMKAVVRRLQEIGVNRF